MQPIRSQRAVSLLSASTARESKAARYILNISCRDTPWVTTAVGQASTLSVVRDTVVCRIDPPPVRVSFGIIVTELVLVCAVTCGAAGGTN